MFIGEVGAQEAQENQNTQQKEVQSVVSTPSRNIYDLMYLPARGTFFGSTTYKATSNTTNYQYLGRDFIKVESDTTSVEQEFGYTFTSSTLVGFGIGYQFDSEAKSKYGPGSNINGTQNNSAKEKGMEDPSVFLRHRFSESEADSGNDVDLVLKVSPKTGKSKGSTLTAEGNAKRGASEITLGVDLGKKTANNAWNARLSYAMTTKATTESAANSNNRTTADAYGILAAEFMYQWVINPKFAINLGAGLGVIGKQEQENLFGDFKNHYDSAGLFIFNADFMFNPTPDISLQFGIRGVGIGEHDLVQTDISDGSHTPLTVEQNATGEATFSAHYQF